MIHDLGMATQSRTYGDVPHAYSRPEVSKTDPETITLLTDEGDVSTLRLFFFSTIQGRCPPVAPVRKAHDRMYCIPTTMAVWVLSSR